MLATRATVPSIRGSHHMIAEIRYVQHIPHARGHASKPLVLFPPSLSLPIFAHLVAEGLDPFPRETQTQSFFFPLSDGAFQLLLSTHGGATVGGDPVGGDPVGGDPVGGDGPVGG